MTANILQEYKSKYCNSIDPQILLSQYLNIFNQHNLEPEIECAESIIKSHDQCHPEIIDQYLANLSESHQLEQKLRVKEFNIVKTKDNKDITPESISGIFLAISEEFQKSPRLPIEIIHGGNGLNNTFERGTPIESNRQRKSHVSLITGRRLTTKSECQILIRNSYQTRCRPRTGSGIHMFTGRDCEGETDSTWFTESHITRFIGAVRITSPIHPAARYKLARDGKMKQP